MKKTLLFGALALFSTSLMAQESTKLVENWSYAITGAGQRTSTGVGDKIYISNTDTKSIEVWDCNGKTNESYYIGKWCEANLEGYYNWINITSDDAGNILVGLVTSAGGSTSGTHWLVLPADNRNNMQLLTLTLPDGVAAGRIDDPARIVGDVFKKAYFPILWNGQSKGALVTIKGVNGVVTHASDENLTFSTGTMTVNNNTVIATILSFAEMENASNEDKLKSLYARPRGNNTSLWKCDGSKFTEAITKVCDTSAAGLDVFKIGADEYAVVPYPNLSATRSSSSFEVISLTDGSTIAYYQGAGENYEGSLEARVRDNGLAIIYASGRGCEVSMCLFGTEDQITAIEEVEVDANAPVEYYNLQGVKVANPENGIFIKKQGTKATKVVL